jgi:hypothetical protein
MLARPRRATARGILKELRGVPEESTSEGESSGEDPPEAEAPADVSNVAVDERVRVKVRAELAALTDRLRISADDLNLVLRTLNAEAPEHQQAAGVIMRIAAGLNLQVGAP